MKDFIDVFCGAGGLSLGLEDAGLSCIAAVEMNIDACETFVLRHRAATIHDIPIQQVNFTRYEGIPLLVGGPPCQPFSAGGKGLACDDSRDMIPEFVRAVKEAQPDVFLMENVPGLAGPTHRLYLEQSLVKFSRLGYRIAVDVINAAEYGIPQKRRRLIVVGVREGIMRTAVLCELAPVAGRFFPRFKATTTALPLHMITTIAGTASTPWAAGTESA